MAIRLAKPGNPTMGNKTYALAQYAQVLDLDGMAEHMSSHDSKYNKGDVMAVATQLTSCIREQLLLGNRIHLGDLGTFSVRLECEPADNAETFTTSLIKDVRVRWEPSTKFKDLINEATFQYVGTRDAQAAARKAEKEALNALATVQPPADDTTGDDSGGGDLGE